MTELIEIRDAPGGLVFALHGQGYSFVLRVTGEGLLEHVHYGAPVGPDVAEAGLSPRVLRASSAWHEDRADITLTDVGQAYPVAGASDYRHCALDAETDGGLPVGTLIYRSHEVSDGPPDLSALPAARGGRTLTVTLADPLTGLAADLHYTVWPDEGVLGHAVSLRNEGTAGTKGGGALTLRRALPACLALPPGPYEALHLHGSWAREFQAERTPLPSARRLARGPRAVPRRHRGAGGEGPREGLVVRPLVRA